MFFLWLYLVLGCRLILWNVNLVCNTYISFLSLWKKKIVFCFQFKFYWFIHWRHNQEYLYSLMSKLGILLRFTNVGVRNIDNRIKNYFEFLIFINAKVSNTILFCYVIFINARVESICSWIFISIRVRNIISIP